MGYRFSGFFIDQSEVEAPSLIEAIRARWPMADARTVQTPFVGYGFAFPDYQESTSDEQAEQILEPQYAAFEGLPGLSLNFPEVTFLWVEADCFGGTCLYSGYGCRAGQILVEEEDPTEEALETLVQVLGVKLGPDRFFAPFARGFFS